MKMEDACQPNPHVSRIVDILVEVYPDRSSFLNFQNPFELLIAVILSAQCTDAKVNEVTPVLFRTFPDPTTLAEAPLPVLEKILFPTGFYHAKAEYVRTTSRLLLERFNGEVPLEMEALTSLPGVGRKTANVIRGQLANLPAVIVDTHFKRVVRRLGLACQNDPEKIEREISQLIEPKLQFAFSMVANRHGRAICQARNPKCALCPVLRLCPSG
jgi:endonuclease-3